MGFSIVLPFLVFLVSDLGGNAVVYGLVGATYPLFQFIGSPILGRLSDRRGRRLVLLLSELGTLASWLIFIVALVMPKLPIGRLDDVVITVPLLLVFVARALDGITGGNISVANAYVADISTDANRSHNFGRMGMAGNLGIVLGPGVAAVLGTIGARGLVTIVVAALLSAISC